MVILRNNRRGFLGGMLGLVAASEGIGSPAQGRREASDAEERRRSAIKLRQDAATRQGSRPMPIHLSNGDEESLPRYVAAFTKGLPHSQLGEVVPAAYETLLRAIRSGKHSDFESVSIGSGRRLTSPQAAYSYVLEGADSHSFEIPLVPQFDGPEAAAEMAELYWQALARDVPFAEYATSPVIREAAGDLSRMTAFSGPKMQGAVAPETIFRGNTQSDLQGHFISQFLWRPVPQGSGKLDQRYATPKAGSDFMASYPEWLQIQTGVPPWRQCVFEDKPRYIRNGRDLAEYVHYDFLYQAFQNAALILLDAGPETVLNYNSYRSENNPYVHSKVQDGFVTFGFAQTVDWVARVTTAALKAAWCQKWLVHRRIRPEAFSGRVHHQKNGSGSYPIHSDLLQSPVLDAVKQRFGSFLLPQAYPEGSPLHPAYPSGHATVAGACVTVLKALFDENALLPDCVAPSADGLSLVSCSHLAPTVGNELNKLAFNICCGRDFAGIHYRTDATGGLALGEQVAITVLQDLAQTLSEEFAGFQFHRFDGMIENITTKT